MAQTTVYVCNLNDALINEEIADELNRELFDPGGGDGNDDNIATIKVEIEDNLDQLVSSESQDPGGAHDHVKSLPLPNNTDRPLQSTTHPPSPYKPHALTAIKDEIEANVIVNPTVQSFHGHFVPVKRLDTDADELDVCLKSFSSILTKTTYYPCPVFGCDKNFSRPSRVKAHLLSHSGERPFKCDAENCVKAFSRQASLKRHIKNRHRTEEQASSANAEEQASSANRLKCSSCPKTFANKYSLQKHIKLHHGREKERHNCEKCGQSFSRPNFLSVHMAKAHQIRKHPHECKLCHKTFRFPNKLRLHHEKHHVAAV